MSQKRTISGLYGITIDNDTQSESHVRAALEGGARVIQFRNKSFIANEFKAAENIATLCREFNAAFIVNDNVDLALAVDADGVHLGEYDLDLASARKKIGNKIIGVSCYNKLELALEAEQSGADYVAFGRFFSSSTKPKAVVASIDLLHEASKRLTLPIVAIGGITVQNAASLVEAGANSVAVIEGLFNQQNIKNTAEEFSKLFR